MSSVDGGELATITVHVGETQARDPDGPIPRIGGVEINADFAGLVVPEPFFRIKRNSGSYLAAALDCCLVV